VCRPSHLCVSVPCGHPSGALQHIFALRTCTLYNYYARLHNESHLCVSCSLHATNFNCI
jgi:hypothetical protein